MRDSIFAFLVVLAIIGGFYGFSKSHSLTPNIGSPTEMRTAKTLPKASKHDFKGEHKNETSNDRKPVTAKNHGKNARASVNVAQAEKLPSIYKAEDSRSRLGFQPESESAVSSEEKNAFEGPDTETKVVHGVPVMAWVRSRKSQLAYGPIPAPMDEGLRVFLNCTELKKNPEALNKSACSSIVANKTVAPTNLKRLY